MIELTEVTKREAIAVCLTEFGPSEHMTQYLDYSDHFITVYADGGLVGVFGARRPHALSTAGFVWFAERPLITQNKTAFLRASKTVARMFLAHYSELIGISYDPRAVAWLKWLGAQFGPLRPGGWRAFSIKGVAHG